MTWNGFLNKTPSAVTRVQHAVSAYEARRAAAGCSLRRAVECSPSTLTMALTHKSPIWNKAIGLAQQTEHYKEGYTV